MDKRAKAKWLWAFVAIAVFFVILIALVPPELLQDAQFRTLDDPLVATHMMALFPLILAIYHDMKYMPWFFSASVLASIVYHSSTENFAAGVIDSTFANSALIVFSFIFYTNTTKSGHNPHYEAASVIIVALAMGCFFLPHTRTEDRMYRQKVHSMWHLLAYALAGLVLMNYQPGKVNPKASRFIQKLQATSW